MGGAFAACCYQQVAVCGSSCLHCQLCSTGAIGRSGTSASLNSRTAACAAREHLISHVQQAGAEQ